MDLKLTVKGKNQWSLIILSVLLISAGVLTMIGWIGQFTYLIKLTNHTPMLFNTALCFTISGFIFLFFLFDYNRIVLVFNTFIFIFSSLILSQYIFNISIGLDTLLVTPYITAGTLHPGRMAPNTALGFLLFACFVYLSQTRSPQFFIVNVLFPSIYGLFGFMAIVGYFFNLEQAYSWGTLSFMSIQTAFCFVMLALASFLLLPIKLAHFHLYRSHLLDYTIFAISFFCGLLLWQIVKINYIDNIKRESLTELNVFAAKISTQITGDIQAIERLFYRFDNMLYSSQDGFQQDVDNYFRDMVAIEVIKVKGQYFRNPFNKHLTALNCQTKNLTQQLEVTPEREKLCISTSNFSAIINLQTVITNFLQQGWGANFIITLKYKEDVIFQNGNSSKQYINYWGTVIPLDIYGKKWTLIVYPNERYINKFMGIMPIFIFSLGVLIAFLFLLLIRYRRKLSMKEKALVNSEKIKTTILNSTLEGILGISKDKKINFMNDAAKKLLGFSVEAQKTKISFDDLIVKSDNESTNIVQDSLLKGKSSKMKSGMFYRDDGSALPVSYSSSPLIHNDIITSAIVVFEDISERLEFERKLKELALYDSLTNLPNRHSLINHLSENIARAQRHNIKFSLCFLDVDHFKQINDTYGHHVGDLALKHVAETISKMLRKNDFIGRFAGDEFCIILDGLYLPEDIKEFIKKIQTAIKKPLTYEGISLVLDLSIGIVTCDAGNTAEQLLIEADKAMYEMKKLKALRE